MTGTGLRIAQNDESKTAKCGILLSSCTLNLPRSSILRLDLLACPIIAESYYWDTALMLSDAQILDQMKRVFASVKRPAHFTDFSHCEECAEHDALLRARNLDTLAASDVGNPGWNPICFITSEGFCYYFPALVRLALSEPTRDFGWYLPQLLFHLNYEGSQNCHLQFCSRQQRQAIAAFLRYIAESRREQIIEEMCVRDMKAAIDLWDVA